MTVPAVVTGRTAGRTSQQILLLRAYAMAERGLTNEEAGLASGLADDPVHCYWKRCSELRQKEWIEETGEVRYGRSARPQKVHRITDEGLERIGLRRILD